MPLQRPRALPPLALLAPLLLALQLWPGAAGALSFYRPRFAQGAWWEPFSAQFVHLGLAHALANAAALLLLAWLLRRGPAIPLQLGLLTAALAGVALLLVLDAGCAHYAGFSGALHGWLGGALAASRPPSARATASSRSCRAARATGERSHAPLVRHGLLVLLLLKVMLELAGWLPAAWDFAVYYPSHVAGLAGGLCAAGIVALARRARASPEACQQRG